MADDPETGEAPEPAPAPPTRRRRGPGRWRLLFALPLQLLLLLLLLTGLALGTRTGLRTLAALGTELAPEYFALTQVEGRLLGRLALHELRIQLPTLTIAIGQLELDWSPLSLLSGTLPVTRLDIRDLDLTLTGPGDDDPLQLPALRLPVGLRVAAARLERLRIQRAGVPEPLFVLESAALAGSLHAGALDLTQVTVSLATPALRAAGQGRAELAGAYPLSLDLDLELARTDTAPLRGRARLEGDLQRLRARLTLDDGLPLALEAELADPLNRLAWEARLRAQGLALSSVVPAAASGVALTGEIDARGTVHDFAYRLTAAASGAAIPPFELSLRGEGDHAGTRLTAFALTAPDGQITGTGTLAWSPALRGAARLEGAWRGYPVAAAFQAELADGRLRIDELTARSGPSRVGLRGTAGLLEPASRTLELNFELDAPELASLAPGARGRLQASGQLSGTLTQPRLRLDLAATAAAVADLAVARLSGSAELDLAPNGRFALELDGAEPRVGDRRWERLSARGAGQMAAHRLELTLTGAPLNLTARTTGRLEPGGAYRGRLEQLELGAPDAGTWRLRAPAPFAVELPRLTLGPLCLNAAVGDSGGCLEFAREDPARWTAALDAGRIELGRLNPLLPPALRLDGSGTLRGRFAARGGVLDGQARLELPNARVHGPPVAGREEPFEISGTALTLDAGPPGLTARLRLPLAGLGAADGELRLPDWRLDRPVAPAQALAGRLRAHVDDFRRLDGLVSGISELRGRFDADLRLGGTLGRPAVQGEAGLREAAFQVPLFDLRVSALSLTASAPTWERVELRGQAAVGGGRLDLTGDARFGADDFAVALQLDSTPLRLANTREYFLVALPRLALTAAPAGARLSGEVRIPEARIRPRSLPAGTVTPSPDVVVGTPAERRRLPLEIDVRLVLGDAVSLDAFGVRGRLAGELRLLQPPGRELLGDGQLQIVDGQYRFTSAANLLPEHGALSKLPGLGGIQGLVSDVGPALTIVQGRLVFARSPLDNPGLLLEAEREQGSTSAGVRVHGTLREPKLAFFSESDPGLSQAEITKYLLTGIAPGSGTQGSEGGLAVGTYVTPKLYLEYENGLGDEPNSVRLRYDLTNRIELETRTGETQGAGIYFSFER